MEFDIEKLILIMQEHSVLYYTRNTNYKNIVFKEILTQQLTKQEAVTSNIEPWLYKQFSKLWWSMLGWAAKNC